MSFMSKQVDPVHFVNKLISPGQYHSFKMNDQPAGRIDMDISLCIEHLYIYFHSVKLQGEI